MGLNIMICVDDTPNSDLTQMVSSVEVYEKIDQNTTYKLHFLVDICDADIAASLRDTTDPGSMLSIIEQVNDDRICLVKGPVTHQQIHLVHGGAGSWIYVEGEDTAYNMNRTTNFQALSSVTDADIATQIITGNDNMTADVQPTPASQHDENNHSIVQHDTDLNFIKRLARRNTDFHFWITYASDGTATGHFKPRDLSGDPANTLTVNLANNNIDSLSITSDSRRPSQTEGRQLDLHTKNVIGGPVTLEENTLGATALDAASGGNAQSTFLSPTVDDAGALQARGESALAGASWFINATCRSSLARICSLVRFHTVISVQGAGSRFEGKYYVNGVKHTIDAAGHVMDIELARNAWGN